MMYRILLLNTLLLLGFNLNLIASDLKANINFYNYYSGGECGYTDFYFDIDGNSIKKIKNSDGTYQGAINLMIEVSKGDSIFFYENLKILSPSISSDTSNIPAFSHKLRAPLRIGTKFNLNIKLDDANHEDEPVKVEMPLILDFDRDEICLSDILIVEDYNKAESNTTYSNGGLNIKPINQAGTFYFPPEYNKLQFYTELSNLDGALKENEKVLLRYFVETFESRKTIQSFGGQQLFNKQKGAQAVLVPMNISQLGSGNYNLVVEVIDQQQKILKSQRLFFQRNNPIDFTEENLTGSFALETAFVQQMDSTELSRYTDCLYPISTSSEIKQAEYLTGLGGSNSKPMGTEKEIKSYFYSFWLNRNLNEPEAAWLNYKKEVDQVNKEFKTRITPGCRTDRGRVYLKYGKPNQLQSSENEPSSLPYQIWQYYAALDQTNLIFVFTHEELSTNNFELLHSNARGEPYQPNWRRLLHKRNTPLNNLDNNSIDDHFGSDSDNNEFQTTPR